VETGLKRCLAALLFLLACGAQAEDNVLLIQTGPQGFVVWHTEGETRFSDDEILEIMTTAQPGGGEVTPTRYGPAIAYVEGEAGVIIRLPGAPSDRALLVDRDACGHVVVWHVEGKTQLPEEQLTEIALSALPDGGPRLRFGDRYAKAFLGRLGITVTLWRVPPKK
jgi:hypothetical protein